MKHTTFITAYHAGRITVTFDPKRSGQLLSARLLLPLFMLPFLGLGVALALLGWMWTGLGVIAAGIIVPRLVKRSAPHFLMTQILDDSKLYDEVVQSGVMRIEEVHREQPKA